jgi:hypothetical protein
MICFVKLFFTLVKIESLLEEPLGIFFHHSRGLGGWIDVWANFWLDESKSWFEGLLCDEVNVALGYKKLSD